jgi:hypothetical protein
MSPSTGSQDVAPKLQSIKLCGHWWIIRGRHGTGFHKFDAMNMSQAEAMERAQTLLPTITDDQVRTMWEMLNEPTNQTP